MLKRSGGALLPKIKFGRDERGVTLVEFALLSPIFVPLIFSVFETSVVYTKIAMVNHAVSTVSKDIYIGTASSGTLTYDVLEQNICDNMVMSGDDCTSNLVLELTEIASLADLPDTDAVCEYTDIDIKPAVSYDPGGSSSIVFMRVCFVTDIFTPGIGFGLRLPKTDGDKFALVSSAAFVNEPY